MVLLTLILAFVCIATLATYLYLMKYRGVVESFGLPYVKPFFVFGSPPFLFHRIVVSEWLRDQFKKFGRTWASYDGITPTIYTIDPDFIKQVTVKQFENFTDVADLPMPEEQKTLDIMSGDAWRSMRKVLSPTFTSGKLKGMTQPMDGMVDRTLDYMSEKIKVDPKINVKPIIQGFALDTIFKCGFGLDTNVYKGEDQDLVKLVTGVVQAFNGETWANTIFFFIFFHFPILFKYMPLYPEEARKLSQMTHDMIDDRIKKNVEIGDFIDRLKHHKKEIRPPLTDKMMDTQGMIFIVAGYETTASTLGRALYCLAKFPQVQDQLFEEVSSICSSPTEIDQEAIGEMHLLEGAIMETLRLYPPATEHVRVCTKDCVVNGIKIPKHTRIRMPNHAAHLNEEFFPEPYEFRPQRFLKENADQIKEYTWRPFGSGNRICIGQRFAMTEMKIFLAKFVARFKVIEVPETEVEVSKGSMFFLPYKHMIVKMEERK